jgi:transcriptional regulator with XRE-family HTH domain
MSWKIHNRVRYYRERNGWTQETLYRISGVHKATISALENDQIVRPHPSTRQKLAKVLNVKVWHLFPPVRNFIR